MASGVAGTARFAGMLVGVSALGAVLNGRVSATIAGSLPDLGADRLRALVQTMTAGHPPEGVTSSDSALVAGRLADSALASGYSWLFLVAAVVVALCAIVAWALLGAEDASPA